MLVIVNASEDRREDWPEKKQSGNIELVWVQDADEFANYPEAEAFFDLRPKEENYRKYPVGKLVFINLVEDRLESVPFGTAVRINGWPGFLNRNLVELVARQEQLNMTRKIMDELGWQYKLLEDEPGMVAPRIVAMIINEAYFALGEGVSSREEIDTAMKLGTNYPYGPFEWSRKIGIRRIHDLLKKLAGFDDRYLIAPALEEELKTLNE